MSILESANQYKTRCVCVCQVCVRGCGQSLISRLQANSVGPERGWRDGWGLFVGSTYAKNTETQRSAHTHTHIRSMRARGTSPWRLIVSSPDAEGEKIALLLNQHQPAAPLSHTLYAASHTCVCVCVCQGGNYPSKASDTIRWAWSQTLAVFFCCQSHFLSLFVHTQLSEQQFTDERAPQSALSGLVTHSHSLANTSFCFSLLFSLRRLEIRKWSLHWDFISGSFHRPARCCFRWRWRFKGQQAHQPWRWKHSMHADVWSDSNYESNQWIQVTL